MTVGYLVLGGDLAEEPADAHSIRKAECGMSDARGAGEEERESRRGARKVAVGWEVGAELVCCGVGVLATRRKHIGQLPYSTSML